MDRLEKNFNEKIQVFMDQLDQLLQWFRVEHDVLLNEKNLSRPYSVAQALVLADECINLLKRSRQLLDETNIPRDNKRVKDFLRDFDGQLKDTKEKKRRYDRLICVACLENDLLPSLKKLYDLIDDLSRV